MLGDGKLAADHHGDDRSSVVSRRSTSPTSCPSRMTVARLQTRKTSSILCET